MIKLIIGKKGSGKTKKLVEMVNSAAETSLGNVVCIEKGDVLNSVNLPNVAIEKTGDAKICVISKAADGIADKISAAAGITVLNCASGTKKDMAYTVLDVKGDADAAKAKIEAVDGVIKVRVIK